MYKKKKRSWVKHLDFMLLDLLGFQLAYRLSYLFLLWYDGSPNESFYSNQACVLFILQLVTSLIISPYSHVLRRSRSVGMLNAIKTTAVVLVLDIIYLFVVHESYIISRAFFFVLAVLSILYSMWNQNKINKAEAAQRAAEKASQA